MIRRTRRSGAVVSRAAIEALENRKYLTDVYMGEIEVERTGPMDISLFVYASNATHFLVDWDDYTYDTYDAADLTYDDTRHAYQIDHTFSDHWYEHRYSDGADFKGIVEGTNDDPDSMGANAGFSCYGFNDAPYATLNYTSQPGDGPLSVSLIDAFDSSAVDTTAGFHYSISAGYNSLANSYDAASGSNSQSFNLETSDIGRIWARIFDSYGGYRDYNVNVPGLSVIAASSSQINLTWDRRTVTGESGWGIQWSTTGSAFTTYNDPVYGALLPAGMGSRQVNDLGDGTRYWFRVRAVGTPGTAGDTVFSPKRAANTYLNAPTNFKATVKSSSRIDLTWTDNSSKESGYRVYRSTSISGPWEQLTSPSSPLAPNTVLYSNTGLADGTKYYYYVQAFNELSSADSSHDTATTILPAPSNLAVQNIGTTTATLTWNDQSTDETGFRIYRSVNGEAFATSSDFTIAGTHSGSGPMVFQLTGLNPSTNYAFRVEAYNQDTALAGVPVTFTTASTTQPITIQGPSSAETGDTVHLVASGGSGSLTYTWDIYQDPTGANKHIRNGNGSSISFQPMELGEYVAKLTVLSGGTLIVVSLFTVNVRQSSLRPIVIRGADKAQVGSATSYAALIDYNDPVFKNLDWYSSSPVTFSWVVTPNASHTFYDSTLFFLPSVIDTDYTITCTVSVDGIGVFHGSKMVRSTAGTTAPFKNQITESPFGLSGYIEGHTSQNAVELPNGNILALSIDDVSSDGTPPNEHVYGMLQMFKANLEPDTTWGSNGVIQLIMPLWASGGHVAPLVQSGGDWHEGLFKLAVQNDGKIIIAGSVMSTNFDGTSGAHDPVGWVVGRYDPDGSLDSTFGENGFRRLMNSSLLGMYDMAIEPDGKIVLAGEGRSEGGLPVGYYGEGENIEYVTSRRAFAVARLNSDGSMDAAFGNDSIYGDSSTNDGILITEIIDDSHVNLPLAEDSGTGFMTLEAAYSLAFQPTSNGFNILVGGIASSDFRDWEEYPRIHNWQDGTGAHSWSAIIRLDSDGNRDTSFGNTSEGRVFTPVDNGVSSYIVKLAMTPDNKIVAIGNDDFLGMPDDPVLMGEGGHIGYEINLVAMYYRYSYPPGDHIFVARYDANGHLDSTFGTAGVELPVFQGYSAVASGYVDSQNRIILAGSSGLTGNGGLLARLLPNGDLDTSTFPRPFDPSRPQDAYGYVTLKAGSNPEDLPDSLISGWASVIPSELHDDIILFGEASNGQDATSLYASVLSRFDGFTPGVNGLRADVHDNSIELNWTDAGPGEEGFFIYRRSTNIEATEPWTSDERIGVVGVDATSFTDFHTTHGSSYTYRVTPVYTIGGTSTDYGIADTVNAGTAPENSSLVLKDIIYFDQDGIALGENTDAPSVPIYIFHSNIILKKGVTYVLRASGSAFLGGGENGGPDKRGDAEYMWIGTTQALNNSTWPDYSDYGIKIVDGGVVGSSGTRQFEGPTWGEAASDSIYTTTYIGKGEVLDLYYNDNNYHDNKYTYTDVSGTHRYFPDYGDLQVEIYSTEPDPAAHLDATANRSKNQIELAWSWSNLDLSDGVQNLVTIERKKDGAGFQSIATFSTDRTSFVDDLSDVTDGDIFNHQFTYRLVLHNNKGGNGASNEAFTTLENRPPDIDKIDPQLVYLGNQFKYTITANDPEDGQIGLRFAILNPLPGMVMTNADEEGTNTSGQISGFTPNDPDWITSSSIIQVRVYDQNNAYSDTSFSLTVGPNLSTIPHFEDDGIHVVKGQLDANHHTVHLSASPIDDGPSLNLKYTWSVVSRPDKAALPTFVGNGTNAAASLDVELTKAGRWVFAVDVDDSTSTTISFWHGKGETHEIDVDQFLTSVLVVPNNNSILVNSSRPLTATARDQFGDPLTVQPGFDWSIQEGPGTLSSVTDTSAIYNAPSSVQALTVSKVRATIHSDTLFGDATLTIPLTASSPTIQIGADGNAVSADKIELTVLGSVAGRSEDELTYRWQFDSKPDGAADPIFPSFNGTNQAKDIIVTCDPNKPLIYSFTVTITDKYGQTITDNIILTETQHLHSITLTPLEQRVLQGSTTPVLYQAVANDEFGRPLLVQPTSFTWKVDGTTVSETSSEFSYSVPSDIRSHIVYVQATEAGTTNTASTQTSVTVVNSADPIMEFVSIGGVNTASVLVDGDRTVNIRAYNPFGSLNWHLWLVSSSGARTLLNSGSDSVGEKAKSGYEAATLQPALLANGVYTLELTDSNDLVRDSQQIEVRTQFKLGSLKLPITDLQVPLPTGGSITVTRVYDSSNADQKGDFGNGWTLLMNDTSLTTTATGSGSAPAMRAGDLVYITLPDGGQRIFEFMPKPLVAGYNYYAQFVSIDGSHSKLSVKGDVNDAVNGSKVLLLNPNDHAFYDDLTGDPYNPASTHFGGSTPTLTLTTLDGTQYIVSATSGKVVSSTDSNGNETNYSSSTVSGSGMHLKIDRNTDGTIHEISVVDGSGTAISGIDPVVYHYDSSGNLDSVAGQGGNDVHYHYANTAHPHYLTSITDARGVSTLSAEYSPITGELSRLTDAAGNAAPISTGSFKGPGGTQTQSVTDPAGGQTEDLYDDHGNIIRDIKTQPDGTYLVTVHSYHYNAPSDPTDVQQYGIDNVNSIGSVTDYQPFTVTTSDAAHTYNPSSDFIVHQVIYKPFDNSYFVTIDPDLFLPSDEYTRDGNNVLRHTQYSNYSHGKPQVIETTIGSNHVFTYNSYDSSGNLQWTVNTLGEGTRYVYSNAGSFTYPGDSSATSLTSLPKGLLIATYRFTVTPTGSATMPTVFSSTGTLDTYNHYNSGGQLTSTTNATTGLTTAYTYTAGGQTDTVDRSWTGHSITDSDTDYDDAGRVHVVTDANGKTTTTNYNSLGKVSETIDQYGGHTRYTYDTRGELIRTLYPDGTETRSVYDAMGRVIWATDRYATSTTYSSGSYTNDNTTTANVTHTIYDSLGRVVGTERYKNVIVNISTDVTTSTDTILKSEEPLPVLLAGNELSSTSTYYDDQGRVIESIDAAGLKTGTVYRSNGQVQYSGILSSSAPTGGHASTNSTTKVETIAFLSSDFASYTTYAYDQTSSLPSGAVSYDQVTDANGHVTKTYKDALGRVIKTVFDDNTSTQMLYGVGTSAVSSHSVSGQTITGHQETKIDQLGNATDYFYDAVGRLTDVYLPAVPDALNSNTSTRPHWQYTYDANGNELTQVDPKGHTTTFTYDDQGHELSRTLPTLSGSNSTESWTYDGFGRVESHEDFKDQTTAYVYDTVPASEGRETAEYRFAGGATVYVSSVLQTSNAAEHTSFTYDSLGRQSEVKEYTGTTLSRDTTYSFDPISGQISQVAAPEGTIHYEYDPATGQHTRTYTNSNDTSYVYDSQGRLHTVTQTKLNGSTVSLVTTYTYDPVGNLATVTQPNGDVSTYTDDDLNRLTTLVVTNSGSHKLFEQDYTLLDDGNRDYVIEKRYDGSSSSPFSTTKIDWTYDDDGRLTGETRDEGNDSTQNGGDYIDTYSYDLANNRVGKVHDAVGTSSDETITSTYNADDQLTAVDSTINANDATYGYDANGSQTSVTRNGVTQKYTYDLRNRLVGFDANGDNDTTDTGDASYTYDNAGNRISETTGGVTTYYLIDTHNPSGYPKPIEQKTSLSGAPTVSYILGRGVIGQANSSGAVTYLLSDGKGDTRALVNASGTVTATLDYDVFDNAIGFNPATVGTMWLTSDAMFDSVSGLYFHGSGRQSDNIIGRFVTADDDMYVVNARPITANLYLLDGANPGNMRDFSGHDFSLTGMLVTSGISGGLMAMVTGAYGYAKGWSAGQIAKASGYAFLTGAAAGALVYGAAAGLAAGALGMGATAAEANAVGWTASGLILTPTSLGLAIGQFKEAREHGDQVDQVFAGVNLALAAGNFVLVRFAAVNMPINAPPRYSPAVQRVGQGVIDFLGNGWRVVRDDEAGFVAINGNNTRRFQIHFEQGDGAAPHAHLQILDPQEGWIDAPGTPHRIPFNGAE